MRALTLEAIRDLFPRTKEGRALLAAQEKAELAERQEHRAAIEAIRESSRVEMARLRAEVDAAARVEREAMDRLRVAMEARIAAERAKTAEHFRSGQAIHRHEQALIASSAPEIHDLWDEIRRSEQHDRHTQIIRHEETFLTMDHARRRQTVGSNMPNIKAHLTLLQQLADAVLGWRLEALPDEELQARIRTARAQIATSRAGLLQVVMETA
jgi:hypothetical protein